jgi:hypothetical protein
VSPRLWFDGRSSEFGRVRKHYGVSED